MSDPEVVGLLVLTAVVHAAAVGLWFARFPRGAIGCFAAGWFLLLGIFGLNWHNAGKPPFGNMYHVMVVVSGCFLPSWLLVGWKDRLWWAFPAFATLPIALATGTCFMERNHGWSMMPALQSAWFVPHVGVYLLGYSLAGAGFLLLVAGWGRRQDPDLHRAAAAVVRFGFPCITFGMVSGALWAEEAWGAYWSWDAKETWSLITWLCYATALHCELRLRLRPLSQWFQLAGFAALLITLLGVTYLPELGSALHGYG